MLASRADLPAAPFYVDFATDMTGQVEDSRLVSILEHPILVDEVHGGQAS